MIFTISQSFSTQGLCETQLSTDTSNYGTNDQGLTVSDVEWKQWIFKDASGAVMYDTGHVPGAQMSASCPINLLTLFSSCEFFVKIGTIPYVNIFFIQQSFLIPCLGI